VNEDESVLQLFCGTAQDIGKWQRANLSSFVGVDPRNDNVYRAQKRANERAPKFRTLYLESDVAEDDIIPLLQRGTTTKFDHVCAFNGLDDIFKSQDSFEKFFSNVSRALKENGHFFGIMMDSSAVWSAAQKALIKGSPLPQAITPHGNIVFNEGEFAKIGTPFTNKLDDQKIDGFLIHIPTFISFARKCGLEVTSFENCNEFYENYKRSYAEELSRLGNATGKFSILPDQKPIIGLFTTFVLKKIPKAS
jgi:mRNA (guanine-N7-)-methyltransferase